MEVDPPEDAPAIHRNIRRRRKALNMSQRDLAAAITALGDHRDHVVDVSSVSQWERGVSAPRRKTLPRVAAALKTTVDKLHVEAS